jgi:hypothetical protein
MRSRMIVISIMEQLISHNTFLIFEESPVNSCNGTTVVFTAKPEPSGVAMPVNSRLFDVISVGAVFFSAGI